MKQLTTQEKLSWLQLARSENIGPITFHNLIERYGTAQHAINKISTTRSKVSIIDLAAVEKEMASIEKIKGKLIALCEPDYPQYLKSLKDAPPVITALGNLHLLHQEQTLAIVGARDASHNSCKFTNQLANKMAHAGFTIISGLATGIDTAAHYIAYNKLPTIAVIAHGINIIYPRENTRLYNAIIDNGGLILTEFPYNSRPKAHHFSQRNRIISGLSLGVLIVEATPAFRSVNYS